MASLGHIAVGMAAARVVPADTPRARPSLGAIVFWSLLSFLPDADVVGFGLGVRYADEWGHRGATHSFVFSLALGAVIGLAAPRFGRPALRTGVFASLVLASHALLDTLTNGGLGCALFWPFDLTRYFAPWNPIPVSPIGLNFFSPYGMFVAASELLLFAPLIWFALSPGAARDAGRGRRAGAVVLLIGAWLAGLWLFFSTDPVRERVVRVVLRDTTEFTRGFSEETLDTIERGETTDVVRTRLGPPFRELGAPEQPCWIYSRSPDRGYFRARAVCFADGRVTAVIRRWIRE